MKTIWENLVFLENNSINVLLYLLSSNVSQTHTIYTYTWYSNDSVSVFVTTGTAGVDEGGECFPSCAGDSHFLCTCNGDLRNSRNSPVASPGGRRTKCT